jgi:hypothetical protein
VLNPILYLIYTKGAKTLSDEGEDEITGYANWSCFAESAWSAQGMNMTPHTSHKHKIPKSECSLRENT